jgi:hypothetical protein
MRLNRRARVLSRRRNSGGPAVDYLKIYRLEDYLFEEAGESRGIEAWDSSTEFRDPAPHRQHRNREDRTA